MGKLTKSQYPQFALRIPPKLRAKFEEYADEKEMNMTEAILALMRKAVGDD